MVRLGNTILGLLTGEQEVDWAFVIQHTVKRLLAKVDKSKSTPICPYVFHLYHVCDTLELNDKEAYLVGESMLKHNIKLD